MINFIKAEKNDIAGLAQLAHDIWHEYWVSILSPAQIDYMIDKFQSQKAIISQIENENYSYYLINENGINAGYFGISPHENFLFLSKLYLKKEFRKLGLGRKSFEKICEIAKSLNLGSIRLTVNKYNIYTIKAYEKWGFITIESVVTDIGSNFVMDDYIMEYTF